MFNMLIAATLLVSAPVAALAASDTAVETCAELGKLTGTIAMQRDSGLSATDANIKLLVWGLTPELANLVIDIVYVNNPYVSPGNIVGLTYVACIDSLSK